MWDALRLIGALLLIFFIPGMLLVQALFPRKGELDHEMERMYRLALGVGLSIVITILVNFGLNSLGVNPDTGMGYVTTVPITVCLVLLSVLFFVIAWLRGGMPLLGRLHPSLIRFPASDMRDDDIPHIADRQQRFRHRELMKRRFKTINDIAGNERMMDAHSGEQRKYYEDLRKKNLAMLAALETEISQIERGIPERKEPTKKPETEDDIG